MKKMRTGRIFFFLCFLSVVFLASCATPEAPKLDFSGLIWPPAPETPRIKYVALWMSKNSFGEGQSSWTAEIFGEEELSEGLRQPISVSADSKGNIYVADTLGRGIVVFDMEKKTMRYIGSGGNGGLSGALAVAVDDDGGAIWASDQTGKVNKYDKSGKLLISLGQKKEFRVPSGLAVDRKNNRLFIADSNAHKIYVYDLDGRPVTSFGTPGRDDGQLWYPLRVATDDLGRIYVCDTGNFRVQIFDRDYKFLKKFGVVGTGINNLIRPKDIAVDSEGHIWVADGGANAVKVFDFEGTLLLLLGDTGSEPGKFYLPSGIYIDREDRVYTTETLNKRVQVFQYLSEKYNAAHPETIAEIQKKRAEK